MNIDTTNPWFWIIATAILAGGTWLYRTRNKAGAPTTPDATLDAQVYGISLSMVDAHRQKEAETLRKEFAESVTDTIAGKLGLNPPNAKK